MKTRLSAMTSYLQGTLVACLVAAFLAAPLTSDAQSFDQYFEDNTLRLDYILAGNSSEQHIYLDRLCKQPRWAGRRHHLGEKLLEGNGQLMVRDHASQQVIYTWTFSTLFQEWLMYDEAKQVSRAFEASYNIPFPKAAVDVTLTLTDNRQQVVAELTHTVDPTDILIREIGNNGIPFHYVWKGGQAMDEEREKAFSKRDYEPTPYDPMAGVDVAGCIDLAILAEGYTEAEMGKFYADSQRAVDALFAWEPFASLKDRFNVVAVAAPSREAGPSVPHRGTWRETAVGTHYDTFYTQRYLTSQQMHRIYDLLSGVPFEHIMVLVNSDTYGGGGIYNQVTFATSDHPTFREVFVHEFGHSFAGLADEYAYDDMDSVWYPADTEPWEPNITTLHDFAAKWADLMPEGQPIPTPLDPSVPDFRTARGDSAAMARLNAATQRVGVFEGAGYQSRGCYRPAQECRMKVNEVRDFCPVCARAIRRVVGFCTGR